MNALQVAGRIFIGVLAILGFLALAHKIHHGTIRGKGGTIHISKETDPGLFWLMVATWSIIFGLIAYAAIRGFKGIK